MGSLYDIFFAGQLVDGSDESTTRSNIGKLFKANEATLDKLFSGKPCAIKRGVDKAGAVKYKAAMHKAGAVTLIKAQQAQAPAAPVDAYADEDLPSSTDITAAPKTEGDSMTDRIAAMAAEPSASPRAATFGETESASTDHAPEANVADGAPATNVAAEVDGAPAADGEISLAPAGTEVLRADEREVIEELDIDTSAISLAPEGSDVLAEEERKHDETKAPNTDHLSFEESQYQASGQIQQNP